MEFKTKKNLKLFIFYVITLCIIIIVSALLTKFDFLETYSIPFKAKDEGFVVKLPAVLTEMVPVRSNSTMESKEFPGMPDPCISTKESTVQDILCMRRPMPLPLYKNPCWHDQIRQNHVDDTGTDTALKCMPYFHLIGVSKCGTTDFFMRLLMHPDIVPNLGLYQKETFYWSNYRFVRQMTFNEFLLKFKAREISSSIMSDGRHTKITGHGDPMDFYMMYNVYRMPQNDPTSEELLWTTPYVVKHMNPNVKLLLMLRDPVERCYSHYIFHRIGDTIEQFHKDTLKAIDKWNDCLHNHTIRHCIYSKHIGGVYLASFYIVHLLEWLKVFPREQMFIFRTEDYIKDKRKIITDVCNFLNVSVPDEMTFRKMLKPDPFRVTEYKAKLGPMLNETRKLLVDIYRPYTEELARFLKDEKYAFKDVSFA